jgi:hypothetical protein
VLREHSPDDVPAHVPPAALPGRDTRVQRCGRLPAPPRLPQRTPLSAQCLVVVGRRGCTGAGGRLYKATARHLGHSKLETTRIYAKWSDRQLRT